MKRRDVEQVANKWRESFGI